MPRLVKKHHKGPVKVGDKHICMCGMSQNEPFCDKSHHKVASEEEGKLYWYESGEREEIPVEETEESCCGGDCHHHH